MNIHKFYRPFLIYFRSKRMSQFWQQFGLTVDTRVLDVGGDFLNWSLLPEQPKLTILNISLPRVKGNNCTCIVADGIHLPFKDKSFDIVYSNSVIEHLSNFENQREFAIEIQRVGIHHYVQTPNKRFPIEPHLLTPIIHWLSLRLQKRLLRNFTIWGLITRPTQETCNAFLEEVSLLDEAKYKQLFPDSQIWHERVLGITKSLIAVNPGYGR